MTSTDVLMIDGAEYARSEFTPTQASMDHRITQLIGKRKELECELAELGIVIDVLISRLADSLESIDPDSTVNTLMYNTAK